jgi:hypothetical protein
VTAGADRADRIREALKMVESASVWRTERMGVWCFDEEHPPSADIPEGSVVLTADEYAALTQTIAEWGEERDQLQERWDALIRAGDVLSTRLDETPANTSALLDVAAAAQSVADNWPEEYPDWTRITKLRYTLDALDKPTDRAGQQAVRAWLAIAHPNGEGHPK